MEDTASSPSDERQPSRPHINRPRRPRSSGQQHNRPARHTNNHGNASNTPEQSEAFTPNTHKQTNHTDRYSRPSLSQHGAAPRRTTFFSSDQPYTRSAKRTDRNQPQERPQPGPNPRLAQGKPPIHPRPARPTASASSTGEREQPRRGVNGGSLTRRRFSSRPGDNRQAIVEGITQQALTDAPTPVILSSGSRKLRIIPLGGAGEVGSKNMTVFEYGEDIVVIDCGIAFPDKDMPGIDYVIPDVTYLQERRANVRGLVFTHGHEDHIGAVPFIWPKLSCPMYATPLTAGLIQHKLDEAGLKQAALTVINAGDLLHFGKISIEAVRLTHSIPDVLGLAIRCPAGLFFYATDWRIEHTPVLGKPADWTRIAQLAGEGITALFSDSTNVDRPGYSPSEKIIGDSFDKIFQDTKGRIILAQFSSQINRIQQVINSAKKFGRKLAVSGRSMETYVNVAMNLGYLKVPEGMLIDLKKVNTLEPNKIAILSTGSQGEEFSSLTRISEGEHRHVKLDATDTVVIAASAVPGNEVAVAKLIDNLYREGANVIYSKNMDIHVSGHPSRDELKFMIAIAQPKYFIPIHGDYRMIVEHGKLAVEMGVDPNNIIIMENGQITEFDDNQVGKVSSEKAHVGDIMIDGLGVGDVGQIVIRDRQAMAKEGIVTVFMVVKQKTGEPLTSPDIISRGFIYMREAEEFMDNLRKEIKTSYSNSQKRFGTNWDDVKQAMREDIMQFIVKSTGRNPMVIPVIVTI